MDTGDHFPSQNEITAKVIKDLQFYVDIYPKTTPELRVEVANEIVHLAVDLYSLATKQPSAGIIGGPGTLNLLLQNLPEDQERTAGLLSSALELIESRRRRLGFPLSIALEA